MEPLLIACADIHLSENPPAFRSAEPDWFLAQARQLRWLRSFAKELHCPVVIAGDLFDRAIGTTRLANFAADECPFAYAVAGNHDLPYHSLERISSSSYGSLIRAKRIIDINGVIRVSSHGVSIALHGFPFGAPLFPCKKQADLDIAVVHKFVWSGRSPLAGILSDSHIDVVKAQFPGYDFYIFGDNHGYFLDGNVVNCGGFYRRATGEENVQPVVAVIYQDHIEAVAVPVEEDVLTPTGKIKKNETHYDFSGFFESLRQAESLTCDVEQLLHDYLVSHQVEPDVHTAIVHITES